MVPSDLGSRGDAEIAEESNHLLSLMNTDGI